jgi:sortase A
LADQLAAEKLQQEYRLHRVAAGDPLFRIKIAALHLDLVAVEGTSSAEALAGIGHFDKTPWPCETGNVAVIGASTTSDDPFARVEQLRPGDAITLETPIGTCTYEVGAAPRPYKPEPGLQAGFIVASDDTTVLDQDPSTSELTLLTPHPRGSAATRLAIRAHKPA